MLDSLYTKLGRIFNIDVKYLATGGFYLSLGQILSAFIGLGMTIAYANLIPQETFGTYRYILALYGIFAIGTLPGIDTAVTQSTIHNFDGSLRQGFVSKLKFGTLALLSGILYASYNFFSGNTELGYLILMMAFSLPIMEAGTVGVAYLNGKKLYKEWAGIDITTQIVSSLSLFCSMLITQNIFVLSFAYFIPYIVIRLYTVYIILPKYTTNDSIDPGLIQYGKHMTGFQIVTRIIGSIDQIALFHFLGPAQVAIFSLAQAIPMRLQSLLKISGLLALPKFANKSHQESAKILIDKILIFGIFIFVGCILFVITAPYIFTFLLPKYLSSTIYAQVLVFYTLSAVTYPFSSLLLANKRIKENYYVSTVSFITKIACVLIFVPIIGIWGAVIGVLISAFSSTIISITLLKNTANQS